MIRNIAEQMPYFVFAPLFASFLFALIYRNHRTIPFIVMMICYVFTLASSIIIGMYISAGIDLACIIMWWIILKSHLRRIKKEKQSIMAIINIVAKVQIPLATNEPEPQAYIYDEGKEYEIFLPISEEISNRMNGRPKAFFKTTIKGTEEKGFELVSLNEEVPDPGW